MSNTMNPYIPGIGLFLRDLYAMQAMQAMMMQCEARDLVNLLPHYLPMVCESSFKAADAMLEARLTQPQPAVTVNGFKVGDEVERIDPTYNGADGAIIVRLDFDDPSRPAIIIKPIRDDRTIHVTPYRSDPKLWRSVVAPEQPPGASSVNWSDAVEAFNLTSGEVSPAKVLTLAGVLVAVEVERYRTVFVFVADTGHPWGDDAVEWRIRNVPDPDTTPFVATPGSPMLGVRTLDVPEYAGAPGYDIVLEIDGDPHHVITPDGRIKPMRHADDVIKRLVPRGQMNHGFNADMLAVYVEQYRAQKAGK